MSTLRTALVYIQSFFFISFFYGTSFGLSLKFTAIPDQDSTRLEQRFNGVKKYLETALGVEVDYIPVKSYSASISAFKANQVQLAWFGGLSGVISRKAVPDSMAIAQGKEDREFRSYFIAHTSTGITESGGFPSAIKGKTFTFGSKGSTSGRLMPEYFIRQYYHQSPRKIFKRVGFSGDHTKTLSLVQSGAYQVGVLNYLVWEKALKSGAIDPHKVQVIWKTDVYPDYNWTIRGDVEEKFGKGFIQKVQMALINMKDLKLLNSFPRSAFIKADNSLYQAITDVALEIGILR